MRSTFWNKIEIEHYDSSHKNFGQKELLAKRTEEIAAFFLDSSGEAPFSFAFHIKDYYFSDESYYIRPALKNLLVHSEQWVEVSMTLRSSEFGILSAVMGRLPLLIKLEIALGDSRSTLPSMVAHTFEDAPLLTHVVLRGDRACQFKFNWLSLTTVEFRLLGEHGDEALAFLRETTNLVELTIGVHHEFPMDVKIALIHLPCLERLSVGAVELLTVLETPSLERLKMALGFIPQNVGIITLAFLRRSGIKLKTFVVERGLAMVFKDILPYVPRVDELALLGVSDAADVFKWLAAMGIQELPFNSLILSWPWNRREESLGALLGMIARLNAPHDERYPRAKEVVIQIPQDSQSRVANLKSLCRDRGIRFGFIEEMSTLR